MKNLLIIGLLVVTIFGCKNNTESSNTETTPEGAEIENNPLDKVIEEQSTTLALLQGTWRNTVDPLSTLEFRDNTTKNFYDGIEAGEVIVFSLGNSCANGSNPEGSEEKDKYISTTGQANECYYIVSLDDENLVMSFLGRGNTLSFKREE